MRNSLIFFAVLIAFACKKQDFSIQPDRELSGTNAFVTNTSFIGNISRNDSVIEDQLPDGTFSQNFIQTEFSFSLIFKFYSIQKETFSQIAKTPIIEEFATIHNYASLPSFNTGISVNPEESQATIAPDKHLIITNPKQDANAIYFAGTSFYLNQYFEMENIAGNEVQLGFYDNTSESLTIADEDKITPFLQLSNNPEKNEAFRFPLIDAKQIINQIDKGIEVLASNPDSRKQLTILTYGLYNKLTSADSLALAIARNNLFAENITLNVISLLPTPFLQPLVYKTNGIFQNDIPYVNIGGGSSEEVNDFATIINSRIFPSSATIHNLQRLVNGSAKSNNTITITGTFISLDSIHMDSARQALEFQTYYIKWSNVEEHIPPVFEIRPTSQ